MTTPGDVLAILTAWNGTGEDPAGSNHNFITEAFADRTGWDWCRRGQAWCDIGQSEALSEAGLDTTHASCAEHISALKRGDGGTWLGYAPDQVQAGDLAFFGHNGGDHIEMVAIPGNGGAFFRGCNTRDAVRFQWRSYRGAGFDVYGFGRPAYDGQVSNFPPPLPDAAPDDGGLATLAMPMISQRTRRSNDERAVRIHQAIVGAGVDGDFGPDTTAKTRAWQRFFGLAQDGAVGDKTWTIGLQYELFQAGGHQVVIDGEIGPTTTGVLRFYQGASGLTVDGVAGPATFGALTGQ